MKAQILKIAGVKTEAEFYKKYPTEESFMKKHGHKLKKAQVGINEGFFNDTTSTYGDDSSVVDPFTKAVENVGQTASSTKTTKSGSGKLGKIFTKDKINSGIGMLADSADDILAGIQGLRQDQKDIANLNKSANIASVVAAAAASNPEIPKKRYVRPEDALLTNPLSRGKKGAGVFKKGGKVKGNPTEIQNTYAPNDIYTDQGYTPIAQSGINLDPLAGLAGSVGGMLGSATTKGSGKGGPGSTIGSALGGIAGSFIPIPGVGTALGSLAGGFIGGLFDGDTQKKKQDAEDRMQGYVNQATLSNGARSIQMQNKGFMENGGYMNPEYNPQVIAKFGDYDVDQLFAPPHDADMLRAGGHLKEYTPPSARAMYTGRDLPYQMQNGGGIEPLVPYNMEYMNSLADEYRNFYSGKVPYANINDDGYDAFYHSKYDALPNQTRTAKGWTISMPGSDTVEFVEDDGSTSEPKAKKNRIVKRVENYEVSEPASSDLGRITSHLQQQLYSPIGTDPTRFESGGQMAMGGDLRVHRGEAETMSYNPYLPDGGETVMFRGPSHDNGGMPISFGENGVEVEGGEPAIKLQDGGSPDGNLVVYGNMVIPEYGAAEIGDPKAKGKKFKHYVADLSKVEAKQNKLIDKTTLMLDGLDENDPFDQLKLNVGQANLIGADMKLKSIADKKKNAAAVQNAILDTAEEQGLVSDELAKGRIKYAKANDPYAEFGTKLSKAQDGKSVISFVKGTPFAKRAQMAKTYGITGYKGTAAQNTKLFGLVNKGAGTSTTPAFYKNTADFVARIPFAERKKMAETFGIKDFKGTPEQNSYLLMKKSYADNPIKPSAPASLSDLATPKYDTKAILKGAVNSSLKLVNEQRKKQQEEAALAESENDMNWWETGANALASAMPYIRPTNQIPLDASQLQGEMYSLANNQEEPVYAQTYNPLLSQTTSISLQDQLNEITSQARSAERMAQGDPSALAMIASQAAEAKNKVLGEQFRLNQGEQQRVMEANRQTLNDAQMKNLAIFDQQQQRQAQAKSNTKQQAIVALNSISDKIAKNKLENRELAISENLYNYRFTPNGQAYNLNPPQTFSPSGATGAGQIPTGMIPDYEADDDGKPKVVGYKFPKETKTKKRNGSIVQAIKNL